MAKDPEAAYGSGPASGVPITVQTPCSLGIDSAATLTATAQRGAARAKRPGKTPL